MVKRRDPAAEGMIPTAKRTRFLQWQNVGRLLDYAEKIGRTRFVTANFAQLLRGEKTAKFAGTNLSPRF